MTQQKSTMTKLNITMTLKIMKTILPQINKKKNDNISVMKSNLKKPM